MPVLNVRCKTCGRKFATGMNIDETSFETIILEEVYHICPNGHRHPYYKEDYIFPTVPERRARPILSEEQRSCEHDYVDVTKERGRTDSPYLYLKCKKCGLVRVKDRPKEELS